MVDRYFGGGQNVRQWWTEIVVVVRRLDIGEQREWWWSEGYTVVDRDCGGVQKVRHCSGGQRF